MRSPPPFACIALLIQGGGALGACQAGVYEALAENVVHLIYRAKNYEGSWKDYDFSLTSMQERWCAGYTTPFALCAIRKCLNAPPITKASSPSTFSTTAANKMT
jgi:hypothetical protein